MREMGWGDGVDMEEVGWGGRGNGGGGIEKKEQQRWDGRGGTGEVGKERQVGLGIYKVKQRVLKAY